MLSDPHPVVPADLAACQQLSIEAGWNQNKADWSFILTHGMMLGIRRGERLVATAGVLPYGSRFGWICMVLVTASERRHGLGSQLMTRCMTWLSERGAVAGLDATPAGREVYRRLGFRDVYPLTRYERLTQAAVAPAGAPAFEIRELGAAELDAVATFDRPAFGEDRRALLELWHKRQPSLALVVQDQNGIAGYALGREGRVATQIGPLVARDESVGLALLRACIARVDGPVFIDVPDHHALIRRFLQDHGFRAQRTFTRMLAGRSEPFERPEQVIALTGPEFG